MQGQQVVVPDGYLMDSAGRLVPLELVKDIDLLRDQTVRQLIDGFESTSSLLKEQYMGMMSDVLAFVDVAADKYKAKIGGTKGNITLTSYDGKMKVVLSVDELTAFNEGLVVGKALIDEYLNNLTADSSPEIKTLIQGVFQTDVQGQLKTREIINLQRLNINDPVWERGMQAIRDALITVGSKSSLRAYRRDQLGKWQHIPLAATKL